MQTTCKRGCVFLIQFLGSTFGLTDFHLWAEIDAKMNWMDSSICYDKHYISPQVAMASFHHILSNLEKHILKHRDICD